MPAPIRDPTQVNFYVSEGSPVVVLVDTFGVPVGTMANPVYVSGTILATNPSVGIIGAPIPVAATQVGGYDAFGNLRVPVVTNAVPLGTDYGIGVRIIGGGAGGTSSVFGAPFPVNGTAIGVKDSTLANMTWLRANVNNALLVDGSAVTQPVSAPGGAALALNSTLTSGAMLAQVAGTGTAGAPAAGVVTVQGISGGTPLIVSESRPGTATGSNVTVGVASVVLAAANANRKGLLITNCDGNKVLFVRLGAAAATNLYDMRLLQGGTWVLDHPCYTGAVHGIASGASASVLVTELT